MAKRVVQNKLIKMQSVNGDGNILANALKNLPESLSKIPMNRRGTIVGLGKIPSI